MSAHETVHVAVRVLYYAPYFIVQFPEFFGVFPAQFLVFYVRCRVTDGFHRVAVNVGTGHYIPDAGKITAVYAVVINAARYFKAWDVVGRAFDVQSVAWVKAYRQ